MAPRWNYVTGVKGTEAFNVIRAANIPNSTPACLGKRSASLPVTPQRMNSPVTPQRMNSPATPQRMNSNNVPTVASVDALVANASNNTEVLVASLQQVLTACLQVFPPTPTQALTSNTHHTLFVQEIVPEMSQRFALAHRILEIVVSNQFPPTLELFNSILMVLEKNAAPHERLSGSDGSLT